MYKYNNLLSILVFVLVAVNISKGVPPPPTLTIPTCPDTVWAGNFFLDDGSGPALQQTVVELCHDDSSLHVEYYCYDNNVISNYTQCNQLLYNQDVFEIFSTWGWEDVPTNYLEIELSPHGVLFVAQVANTDDSCSGITDTLIGCENSGIVATGSQENYGFIGSMVIPYDTIRNATYPNGNAPSQWGNQIRLNMYRHDFLSIADNKQEFSCWNPTFMNPPCFHVPSSFGYITLG